MLGWVLGILVWLFIAVLCAVMLLGVWTIVQKLWRK
jgi:TRAP-type C4-dicarboxylate transport system permease small subunit